MDWEGLAPPYSTIVADPPWAYEDHAYGDYEREFLPYSSMALRDIAALPVASLASPGAHLYLWTTNRYLPESYGIVERWGFAYSATLVWCKEARSRLPAGRFAVTTEFVIHAQAPIHRPPREVQRAGGLIKDAREAAGLTRAELHWRVRGTKHTRIVNRWEEDACLPTAQDWERLQAVLPALAGATRPEVPPPLPREPANFAKVDTTWWQWKRGPHSAKPSAFLDVVEQVSTGPYVELFARQPRLGWDSWGWGYEDVDGNPVFEDEDAL